MQVRESGSLLAGVGWYVDHADDASKAGDDQH